MRENRNWPAKGWHVPAAALALIMTAALWATAVGILGIQVMSSRSLHERVALETKSVDRQMVRITEGVDEIAAEYGFQADPVRASITREAVEELDRQIVAWWTGFLTTGEIEEPPAFTVHLEEILDADEGFLAGLNPLAVNSTIESVESRVGEMVRKTAVLFRDGLMRAGIQKVNLQEKLPLVLDILHRMPLIGGLVSLALAGGIALMMSRRIQAAGQYIGGALSAAGLLMLMTMGLIRGINLGGMIGEASEALAAQYAHLERIIGLEGLGLAAGLLILGGLGMAWAARTRRKTA